MKLEEIKDLSLYEKLAKITAEITAVAKNLNVGYGASSYRATGEADVLRAVKPIENLYRVYSYPCKREIVSEGKITSEKTYKDRTEKKETLYIRIKTVYRFINLDNKDEFIEIDTYGDGVDGGDKAPGKAMTYADKYALLKAYKIITGEDPDQGGSENDDVNKLALDYQKLRTRLSELGCNFRDEKTDKYICDAAEVLTQDIQILTEFELKKLLAVYKAMIAAKEGSQDVKDKKQAK